MKKTTQKLRTFIMIWGIYLAVASLVLWMLLTREPGHLVLYICLGISFILFILRTILAFTEKKSVDISEMDYNQVELKVFNQLTEDGCPYDITGTCKLSGHCTDTCMAELGDSSENYF